MVKGPTPVVKRKSVHRAPKTFLRFGSDMFARMKVCIFFCYFLSFYMIYCY